MWSGITNHTGKSTDMLNNFKSSQTKESDLGVPSKRKVIEVDATKESNNEDSSFKHVVDGLQEQIRRLNIELSRYQAKYPPITAEDRKTLGLKSIGLDEDDPLPPWLSNVQFLSPLFLSYDERIGSLKQEVDTLKEELSNSYNRLKSLVTENEQLRSQLQRQLEDKLRKSEKEELMAGSVTLRNATVQDQLDEYQERIALLKEENDILLEQQSALQEEMERLAHENSERQQLKAQLEDTKEKLRQSNSEVQSLSKQRQEILYQLSEMEKLSRELKFTKEEFSSACLELERTRKDRDELVQRMGNMENSIAQKQQKYSASLRQIEEMKESHRIALAEIDAVRRDREELFQSSIALENRFEESQQKEAEAFQHMVEYMEELEEARLERDQAQTKEQQATKEVERMQERLQLQKTQFEQTLESQLAMLKAQTRKQISSLSEELKKLEMENIELKAQTERAIREKRAVEVELDRVKKVPSADIARLSELLDEMRKKVVLLEQERDQTLEKVESMTLAEKRAHNQLLKERSQLESEIRDAQRLIKRLENEQEEARETRNKLFSKLEELQKENASLQNEVHAGQFKYKQELLERARSFEEQKRELDQHIQELAAMQQKSVNELRSQSEMRAKWKDEALFTSNKLERVIQELKEENQGLLVANEDLSFQLDALLKDRNGLNEKQMETQRVFHQMHNQLQSSEQRSNEATEQLEVLLNRENELLKENKVMTNKLDAIALDNNRTQRELEITKRQLNELKMQLKNCEIERSNFEIELKSCQQASVMMLNHMNKLKEDKLKLRERLKNMSLNKGM